MRRLKILWLSHFVPYPPKGGAFQRSYNLLRAAASRHEVHLIAVQHKGGAEPERQRQEAQRALGEFCRTVTIVDGTAALRPAGLAWRMLRMLAGTPLTVSVSESAALRRALRRAVAAQQFDLAHFDTIGLAGYLADLGGIPAVLTHHGAESFMMQRRVALERNPLRKAVFAFEGRLLRRYESRHCPRFADNLVVSEPDRQLLAAIAPAASFTIVPNGVDIAYFRALPPADSHRVVFAGRLDQYSNRDAITYFASSVWPGVRARIPDAELDVLGMNPPAELLALAARDRSIRVHGFVADVRPYFERAAVAVCPIRDGGGTRVKILDNLAMAKPIVSTRIGIEGIEAVPGRDLLVADSPSEFVEQIGRIFADAGLRITLAANGRRLAESRYAWDGIGAVLLAAYARVAGAGREGPPDRERE